MPSGSLRKTGRSFRRCGRVLLPSIPNEMYLENFNYLRPDPEAWIDVDAQHHDILCNLALVCPLFSSLMLPWRTYRVRAILNTCVSSLATKYSLMVLYDVPLKHSVRLPVTNYCSRNLDGDSRIYSVGHPLRSLGRQPSISVSGTQL